MAIGFSSKGAATSDKVVLNYAALAATNTWAIWMSRAGAGGANLGRLWDKRTVGASTALSRWNNGSNRIEYIRVWSTGSQTWFAPAGTGTATNTPIHVAWTHDTSSPSNVPQCFINGASVTVTAQTNTASGSPTTSTDGYVIGNNGTGTSAVFDGILWEFSVWDVVLSSAEIAALAKSYGATTIRKPKSYVKGIRSIIDEMDPTAPTVTGTAVQPHTAIIYPLGGQLWMPKPASGPHSFTRTISESAGAPSDSPARQATYSRTASESAGAPSDAAARQAAASRSASETISVSDAAARAAAFSRTAAENAGAASDAITRSATYHRAASESAAAPSDSAARSQAASRAASESASAPSDSVSQSTTHAGANTRSISESVVAPSDAGARGFIGARSLAESATAPSDASSRTTTTGRTASEAAGAPSDSAARIVGASRSTSESVVAPSDSATRQAINARSLSDAAGAPSDVAARLATYLRAASDAIVAPFDAVHLSTRRISIFESIVAPSDFVSRIKGQAATPMPFVVLAGRAPPYIIMTGMAPIYALSPGLAPLVVIING